MSDDNNNQARHWLGVHQNPPERYTPIDIAVMSQESWDQAREFLTAMDEERDEPDPFRLLYSGLSASNAGSFQRGLKYAKQQIKENDMGDKINKIVLKGFGQALTYSLSPRTRRDMQFLVDIDTFHVQLMAIMGVESEQSERIVELVKEGARDYLPQVAVMFPWRNDAGIANRRMILDCLERCRHMAMRGDSIEQIEAWCLNLPDEYGFQLAAEHKGRITGVVFPGGPGAVFAKP
jgi:hypothetical protein